MTRSRLVLAAAVALLAGACSSPQGLEQPPGSERPHGPDWGPLAIVIDNSTTIAGVDGGTGTIRITPDCVVFVSDGGRGELTLAWRAGHASWNDLLGEVVFDPPYADPVTLADGSRVDLGGSRPAAERWIRTPGPDCPADRFVVSAAEPIR